MDGIELARYPGGQREQRGVDENSEDAEGDHGQENGANFLTVSIAPLQKKIILS